MSSSIPSSIMATMTSMAPTPTTSIPTSVLATMTSFPPGMPTPTVQPQGFYGEMTPSKAANLVGIILFAILWAIHTGLGLWYRQWWFFVSFFIGCGLETAGYIGRYKSSDDIYDMDYFLIQIICLTLGPAFLMAGVYYLLAKLAVVYDEKLSPIRPIILYSAIYSTGDLLSLVCQAW